MRNLRVLPGPRPRPGPVPSSSQGDTAPPDSGRGRHLFVNTLGRLVLLYFVPLVLLSIFFHVQYRQMLRNGTRAHLEIVAEHHARLFDVFLHERLANLANAADDPLFIRATEDQGALRAILARVQQSSDAFVDVGLVDGNGRLLAYAGPIEYEADVNYAGEPWFQELISGRRSTVITDIYLGFRGRPHFTMALLRPTDSGVVILRSALSPDRLAHYLTELEGAADVACVVVDSHGLVQVVTPGAASSDGVRFAVPPREPPRGYAARGTDGTRGYAYGWLTEVDWALVATPLHGGDAPLAAAGTLLLATLAIFLVAGLVILIRTRQVVGRQLATERHEAELCGQLVHAAKLAAVGELAAGIAHEINNPLAIIAEEVGELQDSMDPELTGPDEPPIDLAEHLDAIHQAVFRCRDITRKLLMFVRQAPVVVDRHSVAEILDDVLDTMLGTELHLSNIAIERRYDPAVPDILIDRNQLIQVLVNLVKNAMDAMPGGGTLTVTTGLRGASVAVSIQDTGCGMTKDQLERVFTPFFTTKEPGKGTGLGLSVSYTIIKNFGGEFYVDSAPGRGSLFVIVLPVLPAEPAQAPPVRWNGGVAAWQHA